MKTSKRNKVIQPGVVREGLIDRVIPPTVTPEIQEAWNIVASLS